MQVKTFIDRPILSFVISVMILLVGLIGLSQLAIEQFPDIAPPTIRVSASYTGANAETVMKSVVVPLEEAINGVDNMSYMVSSATNTGTATINVYFKSGTDPDMATVNVQNRIATAEGKLPSDVTKSGVSVARRQTSTVKSLGLYSPNGTYDNAFLNNYFKINIEPQLSRIPGVGEVDINGADYSMRIWLDPHKMEQYGLEPQDITDVLGEQNIESPTGTLGQNMDDAYEYVLKYRGRYEDDKDYGNMVIKSLPDGSLLRVKDVATISLGLQTYTINSEVNGKPGAMCMISQTPGSNANDIVTRIDALTQQIQKQLPPDMELVDLMSTKDFLVASMTDVAKTLVEAILLVVLVVYVFLQNGRSTLIPTLAIIISLVGTFAVLYLIGFTLNTLTLFALVLVIGTVVDDAIVVVEAVQAKFDIGYTSSYEATLKAMGEITTALVTTTLVFMAVFVPVCFMGGTTGTFYTQFGVTMAAAVCISLLNALTFSPALCALIMTPHQSDVISPDGSGKMPRRLSFSSRFHLAFNAVFTSLQHKYLFALNRFVRRRWLTVGLIAAAVAGLSILLHVTKTGLVPDEDMGTVYLTVQTAPGSSLSMTQHVMDKIDGRIKDMPTLKAYSKVTGTSRTAGQGASYGMFIIRLKPWDERKAKGTDYKSVMDSVYKRTADISEAKILVSAQPVLSGFGATNGFEMYVQDKQGGSMDQLYTYTKKFIAALSQRPEIQKVQTSYDNRYPQLRVEVDAAKCKRAGVSPSDVLGVLSGYVGGDYSSNMNRFSKLYRVMVQAAPQYRLTQADLNNMYVRNSDGDMSSIANYLKITKVYGSESQSRFNLFPAIRVNGSAASGYSSGQAIKAIEEVAAQTLPSGYGYEFSGMTREEADNTGVQTVVVFVACIVFIYLFLCALYESVFIPLAVILSVPFGLCGSFIFANLFGIENNIYMQTGVIMLIGLLSKTAILLTQYATEKREAGLTIYQAAIAAAKIRLRPILMTSLTMVIGMLPMAFASGAGANGSRSLGLTTAGGMAVGTIFMLFIVPCLYIFFQRVDEHFMPKKKR